MTYSILWNYFSLFHGQIVKSSQASRDLAPFMGLQSTKQVKLQE